MLKKFTHSGRNGYSPIVRCVTAITLGILDNWNHMAKSELGRHVRVMKHGIEKMSEPFQKIERRMMEMLCKDSVTIAAFTIL